MKFSCRQGEKDLSLVSLGLSHGLMDKISPYWRVRGETNPDLVKPGSNVNGWFRWNLTGLVAPIKCKQNRQIFPGNLTHPSHINSIPGDPAILRLLEKKCHKWGQKILASLDVKFRCLAGGYKLGIDYELPRHTLRAGWLDSIVATYQV